MTTSEKWWSDKFPNRYYAYATSATLGGYPVAGLVDLNIYSKQPDWITSNTVVISLTRAEWLSIVPSDLIIKDGKVQTYVAPASTDTGTSSATAASAATASTTS